MVQLSAVLKKYLGPYYYPILIIVLVIIFLLVGIFVYNRHTKSEAFDVANDNQRDNELTMVVYFFHADWCPHCKKALPEWNGFSQANHGKDLYGYKVNCVDINCTNEDDSKVVEYINKFNIDSYPTVKMIKDGKTIDFDSRITTTSLNSFLETMLSE